MVDTSHELHEIALYVETIDGVEDVEYPVDPDVIKDEARDDIDVERVIRVVTSDVETFHERMRARFDREDAAHVTPLEDGSHGRLTHITLYIHETRQERGYEPVVEFESLDSSDFQQIDNELLDNGMLPITEEVYEDLKQLEFISPAMPEDLDNAA